MIASCLKWLMMAGLAAGIAGAARAQDVDVGKAEFQSSCASCHGADGKGNGPLREQLKVPPSDLTVLARNNNGVFPTSAFTKPSTDRKQFPLTAAAKCQFGANGSIPLSACLTLSIRRIGRWPGRSKARKSSCENASSPLSIISVAFSKSSARRARTSPRPRSGLLIPSLHSARQALRASDHTASNTDAQHVYPPFVKIEQVRIEQRTDEVLHHDHQADP